MKIKRNPDLVAADMDGELVMMSVEQGTYFGLTGIAPQIWNILEQPYSVDEIVAQLLEIYEVSEEVLRTDVDLFLDDMKKNGLVRIA